jgi:hypothetical protein
MCTCVCIIALLKVQGVMGKSVEIMQVMNSLINIPELSKTMQEMAREMEKAGLVDEIVGETFEMLDVRRLSLCCVRVFGCLCAVHNHTCYCYAGVVLEFSWGIFVICVLALHVCSLRVSMLLRMPRSMP